MSWPDNECGPDEVRNNYDDSGAELARLSARVAELEEAVDYHRNQADKMMNHSGAQAARIAELEAEVARLYSGILDLYNAHQNKKVNAEMRASGRWTQIKGLVGEANDRELRAARAEVDKP